jgi:hypothetical protein
VLFGDNIYYGVRAHTFLRQVVLVKLGLNDDDGAAGGLNGFV